MGLKAVGERINGLARLFNIREGLTVKDDCVPVKLMSLEPMEGAGKECAIKENEFCSLLADYYESRGWTREGVPIENKLKELGIQPLKGA